jgi:hypothetical protein
MRFKVTGDHRKVFEKQHFIEFEDLFSIEQIEEAAKHVDQVLGQKARQLIDTQSAQELFKAGRDLWRSDETVRAFVCNRGMAQIAGQLFDKKALHLAFDQALRTALRPGFPSANPASLQKKSCIQPLAGAALIRLSGDSCPAPFFPKKRENIVLLAPDLTLPWEIFFQEPNQSFLLIAYAPAKALYVLEKNDSHVHDLKKLGYGFGDSLNATHHPILYK